MILVSTCLYAVADSCNTKIAGKLLIEGRTRPKTDPIYLQIQDFFQLSAEASETCFYFHEKVRLPAKQGLPKVTPE